jgi:uncharacterized protein (DUF983 family)
VEKIKRLITSRPPIQSSLAWCLKLQCPACGRSGIFDRPFRVKDRCDSCAVLFKREEGFFVGALLINVVTTELVILLAYLASLPVIDTHYQLVLAILFVIALLFPLAFYHHSWSIWLSFDHLVEKLPK